MLSTSEAVRPRGSTDGEDRSRPRLATGRLFALRRGARGFCVQSQGTLTIPNNALYRDNMKQLSRFLLVIFPFMLRGNSACQPQFSEHSEHALATKKAKIPVFTRLQDRQVRSRLRRAPLFPE
jgi:hypothetical protein